MDRFLEFVRERSDYNLAVETDPIVFEEWARFKQEFDEDAPTLRGYDLVWMRESHDPGLRSEIAKDGKVIYERKSAGLSKKARKP